MVKWVEHVQLHVADADQSLGEKLQQGKPFSIMIWTKSKQTVALLLELG